MPYAPQGAVGGGGLQGSARLALVQYTGNNSGGAETQTITGVGFESDLIMIVCDEALTTSSGPRYFYCSNSTAANAYGMTMGGSDNEWAAIANTDAIVPTADGFTLTKTEANADGYKYTALCIKLT